MGKRGPKKGKGGRPRTDSPAVRSDGYKRVTVGPKGKGTQVLEHRAKVGLGGTKGSQGKGTVVDHKDRDRGNNSKGNLRKVSKGTNNKKKRGK